MFILARVRFACAESRAAVRARTGSGNVEADGSVTGPWQLHSGSGNVRLAVGSANGFNLDVHTSSGSIHSDLPITVQGSLGKYESAERHG